MIKTLKLTANSETSISGLGGDRVRIQNRTAGTLYVSGSPGITPCADGVMSIPAGRGDYFSYSMKSDTIYLLSAAGGDVELSGENYYRPFDNAAVTGGVAVGNPVVIDNLQGGVPFPEIVVSGKNLIPYPYSTNHTPSGIDYAVNDDGTIKMNGTANAISYFTVSNQYAICLKKGVSYVLSSAILSGTADLYEIVLQWTNKSGNQSYRGINSTTSKTVVITPDDDIWCRMWIRVYSGNTVDCTISFQLECNVTPTAYEPPITGRELTLAVGGENILTYPYPDSTKTTSGITFTDNGDGTITANGTAINDAYFGCLMNGTITGGKFILRGCPKGGQNQTYNMFFNVKKPDGTSRYVGDLGNGCEVELSDGETIFEIPIKICAGTTVTNLKFNPVALRNGSLINITPDSNPYAVPNDIRQQDGLNVVTVSAGELTVSYSKTNPALKRIYKTIDSLATTIVALGAEN